MGLGKIDVNLLRLFHRQWGLSSFETFSPTAHTCRYSSHSEKFRKKGDIDIPHSSVVGKIFVM